MASNLLLRDQAPLSGEQWGQIDALVTSTARRLLVGRRVLPVFGPLGLGTLTVPVSTIGATESAAIDFVGQDQSMVASPGRSFVPIPLLFRDFALEWRNIEQATQFGMPLDLGPAAVAAGAVARMEDDLIFNGRPDMGLVGLRTAGGRSKAALGTWNKAGGAFESIIEAVTRLGGLGLAGPFAVVASPGMYANMNRLFGTTGFLEIEQIGRIASAGVFLSAVLPEPSALVLSVGPENFDLAIAQDIVAAYLQSNNMNHEFRVMEAVALRIKRPEAVVVLE